MQQQKNNEVYIDIRGEEGNSDRKLKPAKQIIIYVIQAHYITYKLIYK